MSSPHALNQKKIILSTTEVSKLLLSKGRRKINESFLSHNAKNSNNIDLTELASQINIKLSKEGENVTGVADQSMFKGILEKSVLFKPSKALDKSGILNNFEKFNPKENILSKLDKSQNGVGDQVPEVKTRKKLLRFDTNEIISDKAQIKLSYIINNYFPYENDSTPDMDISSKLKNFVVIFYFKIEKNTFLLIKKYNKKFVPLYFWNREEDAKRFGIKYSQITTPGLYFKNFENFTNAFKDKIVNQEQMIKLRNMLNEKDLSYEQNLQNLKNENEQIIENIKSESIQNIKNIKNEYEEKIKEIENNNNKLNEKIIQMENIIKLNNLKMKEYTKSINELNKEITMLKLLNEKLKTSNGEIKNTKLNTTIENKNININGSYRSIQSLFNNGSEDEDENENVNSIENNPIISKFKRNYNIKNFKKATSKVVSKISINSIYDNSVENDKNDKKENIKNNNLNKEKINNNYFTHENIIQIEFLSDDGFSMPKLEEYDIENEEEDKVNKIKNINGIKTYGDVKNKKKLNDSSINNNNSNNNIILYINENSKNKKNNKSKNNSKEKYNKNKEKNIKKYEEQINSKNHEIMILKNKIENLNLEIQNKGQIIEELKYLLESKSNNNSNIDGVKMDSSCRIQNDNSSKF